MQEMVVSALSFFKREFKVKLGKRLGFALFIYLYPLPGPVCFLVKNSASSSVQSILNCLLVY